MSWLARGLFVLCSVVCLSAAEPQGAGGYVWNLPKGFPQPRIPADNPMTAAKVELGRRLFYDTRLSVNGKASCATCHKQELAFTDGRAVSIGATGEAHPRSSMSLVNVAYGAALTWSNPTLKTLEEQALIPMYGEHPLELGLRMGDDFPAKLRAVPVYTELFRQAFPESKDPFTRRNAVYAIASFERSIISADSPYDHYHYGGDDRAVSESAKRGEVLFFSQPLSCFRCHGGFNFSDASDSAQRSERQVEFHNTGLYNLAEAISFPAPNVGIYEFTKAAADVGKFKAPTLRNIAVTGPYMHDGSIATLAEVLEHYAAGGRTIASGPHAGKGRDNPNKDALIGGFTLSARDRDDLIAFLQSLTDTAVLHNARFGSPWAAEQ
jgi:cytochrome c peroxidase